MFNRFSASSDHFACVILHNKILSSVSNMNTVNKTESKMLNTTTLPTESTMVNIINSDDHTVTISLLDIQDTMASSKEHTDNSVSVILYIFLTFVKSVNV